MRDDLDALADLVLCEAMHLQASGQPGAAKAWLGVLTGDPVPGEPTFVRTLRSGQDSSHRVMAVFHPVSVADVDAEVPPRDVVEPTLAAAAAKLLPELAAAVVDVVVGPTGDVGDAERTRLAVAADLGMSALDLVIGGESEVIVRARHVSGAGTRPVPVDLDVGQSARCSSERRPSAGCSRTPVPSSLPTSPCGTSAPAGRGRGARRA